MAKITIREVDSTTAVLETDQYYAAFIPGMSINGIYTKGSDMPAFIKNYLGVPTKVTTLTEFQEIFGESAVTDSSTTNPTFFDKSYYLTKELLNMGMSVYYYVPYFDDSETDAGTTTHWIHSPSTEEEMYIALENMNTSHILEYSSEGVNVRRTIKAISKEMVDRSKYPDLMFVSAGGYSSLRWKDWMTNSEGESTVVATELMYLAGHVQEGTVSTSIGRMDCVALLDADKSINDIEVIKKSFENLGNNGLYSTGFTSWVNCRSMSPDSTQLTYDTLYPGSAAYLMAFAESINEGNEPWLAIAGAKRGAIPNCTSIHYDCGEDASNDSIQSDTDQAINPICNINPWGNLIWGNRTLYHNEDGLKASSFLNIRILTNILKKRIYRISKSLLFEQNDAILWLNFKSGIKSLLDEMVTGRGIETYAMRRVLSETVQRGTLKVHIQIVPIEAVETIDVTVELTDAITITEN